MKNRAYTLMALGAIVLFSFTAACEAPAPEQVEDEQIAFVVRGMEFDVDTRVTPVTSTELGSSGFYVAATSGPAGSESSVWTSTPFTKSDAVFTGGKVWPQSNPGMKFYASNVPLEFDANGTTISLTSLSVDTDVVVAYNGNPTFRSPNTLTFQHLYARLRNVTVTGNSDYTISNISMSITPKIGGTYNVRTGEWISGITGLSTSIANSTPGTKSQDVYLLPDTYTVSMSWRAADGSGVYQKDFSTTYDATFTAGKVHDINVTFSGDAAYTEFNVSVTAWTNGATTNLGTFPN